MPHLPPSDPNAVSGSKILLNESRSLEARPRRTRLSKAVGLGVAVFAVLFVLATAGHQVIDSLLVRFEQARSVHQNRSIFAGLARIMHETRKHDAETLHYQRLGSQVKSSTNTLFAKLR